jgi:hypothetical protein
MAKAATITHDTSAQAGPGGWMVMASEIRRRFRRHRAELKASLLERPTLVKPQLGERLHGMLTAQRYVATQYPYRIAKLSRRQVPPLSTVYVEPRAQALHDPSSPRQYRELPDLASLTPITPTEMIKRHRHSLVVGAPGSGKSTLLRQIVGGSAEWWTNRETPKVGDEPDIGAAVAIRTMATDLLRGAPWLESIAFAEHRAPGTPGSPRGAGDL